MTDSPIENLGLIDTEYAQLLAQDYDPELERQLVALGEQPTNARKMTRFFGRLLGKSPETGSDWEELILDWNQIWAKD